MEAGDRKKLRRIAIGYPPLPSPKGVPLVSQNRQFQWFHRPTYIYPVIPAYAATMIRDDGYEVAWLDGIAQRWSLADYHREVESFAPDLIALESKTPVIKRVWERLRELRERAPDAILVLMGDHVTALPEESFHHSPVDFVLTGGDFDFALRNLVAHLDRGDPLEPGVHWRDGDGSIASSGAFELKHRLDELPLIDRDLTRWKLYAHANGNFKHTPGTYTMVGRDCWWGRCTFCSWTTTFTNFRVQKVERYLDEIGDLIENHGVREIFDDTGTFPAGGWLRSFCRGFVERGYHERVVMGCNMIPGALSRDLYQAMGEANFRFVLFGLESAHQETLERIDKKMNVDDVAQSMQMAKAAGLEPHVTCMVGYPWETREQAQKTLDLTHAMFHEGSLDSLQATVVIPYPGTPLFRECQENGWLRTEDWDDYDMRRPVMTSPIPDQDLLGLTQGIYRSFLSPRFVWRKLRGVRGLQDLRYLFGAGLRVLGHLKDFRGDPARKGS